MFRQVLIGGLLGGAAGGLIIALLQAWLATPLLLTAESFEAASHLAHGHAAGHGAGHDGGAGLLRLLQGGGATLAVAIGYAWMLLAVMAARGEHITARRAAIWALAGFLAAGLAPALGLPPKLPGMAAPDLVAAQFWWAGTALATAAGLYALAFGRGLRRVALGIALIALPHLVGAPMAQGTGSAVPADLAAAFVAVSLALQALVWVVPGALAGHVVARMETA